MRKKAASKMIFILIMTLSAANLWAGGSREAILTSRNFFALGTTCTLSLYGGTEEQFAGVEELIVDIENRMSVRISGSEISAVNAAAGVKPVAVSAKVFEVIKSGIYFSGISNGAFDISVGPLVSLWDIGGSGTEVPAASDISDRLAKIDYRKVVLQDSADGGSIFLPEKGMALEPGGIAKGYAADQAALFLEDSGVDSALINFGGNVLAIGVKADGSNWRIGIQNPDSSRGDYIGIVSINNMAVVTSGKYERFFIGSDGVRYHHILSTRDGFPVENGIAQVSIISSGSITADAMSTTVFSLGLEKGLETAELVEDAEVIIVMENGEIYLTKGIKGSFKLTDNNFIIMEQ